MAASEATRELVWLKRLLNELIPEKLDKPMFLLDNLSAIRLVKNPEFHKRSKHIDIRYHFIREKFENNFFSLEHVTTTEMIADIFTKALPKQRFQYLRSLLHVNANKVFFCLFLNLCVSFLFVIFVSCQFFFNSIKIARALINLLVNF